MNPATGNFLTMDTYEGSIYDPDTLHKYLYANGNPVTYSDPSGNFSAVAMAAGMAINDTITAAYNVHLMGLIAGISNMAVNSLLGEQGIDLVNSFFEGYQSGVFTAGILYLAAAISVKAFLVISLGMATESMIMSTVLLIASVRSHNTKASLVYGSLLVLSVFQVALTFKLSCEVIVKGDKGCAGIGYNSSVDGVETKTFYTVQSSEDAARLLGDGTPWPTEANRSNLGEGVYA